MGKVIMSGRVPKLKVPSNFDPVFSNNTWEQIIKACKANAVPDTWVVGDQKTITINGTDYPIDIIGKNHDTYSDGSGKAPLTFQMHDCYNTSYTMNSSMTNNGGWTSCAMRTTHLPAIIAMMPSEVRTGIKEVDKLTSAGNSSSTINTTADKLFLLSEIEIFGSLTQTYGGEGSQYAYYIAGNSKIKNMNGTANNWWERSPYRSGSQFFCNVRNSDGAAQIWPANNNLGIAFAFCF
jgi:hypothetical protein